MTTNRAPQIGAQLQTRSRTAHRGIGGAHLHGQSSDVPALFAEALKLFQAGHLSEAEEIFIASWKYKLSISTPCTCWVLC